MKVVDIANELYDIELSSPTDVSIASISMWLRTNIGRLNNLAGTTYSISTGYEIVDSGGTEIAISPASILKKMYLIHYYGKKTMDSLGAASVDAFIDVTSDGATVRRINRNEVAKNYIAMQKMAQEELNDLLNQYAIGSCLPSQVAGKDNIDEHYDITATINRLI